MQLPMEKLEAGIREMAPNLSGSLESGHQASCAIMTTDTKPKEVAVIFEVDGKMVTVGGMCKGSGMIHPNMCTMLSFVTTDIAISKELLQEALREDVEDTYNMVGISYFKQAEALILKEEIEKAYRIEENGNLFWDDVVNRNLDKLRLRVEPVKEGQLVEIDTVEELREVNEGK